MQEKGVLGRCRIGCRFLLHQPGSEGSAGGFRLLGISTRKSHHQSPTAIATGRLIHQRPNTSQLATTATTPVSRIDQG